MGNFLHPPPHTPTYEVAMTAIRRGISVLPIKFDGTKQPAVNSWRRYQTVLPTREELARWFADPRYGLAVVIGAISDNLEAVDFDDEEVFRRWLFRIRTNRALFALYEQIATGYEEVSPAGGRHLLYYCEEIEGSQKLAMRPNPDKPVGRDAWREGTPYYRPVRRHGASEWETVQTSAREHYTDCSDYP